MNTYQRLATATLVGAMVLVFAATAHAQQSTPSDGATGRPAPGAATPSTGAPARTVVSDADANHPLKMVRLSELDGVDLYDAGNKKIGEIDEVMVDSKTGAIQQVILQTGGIAGVGGTKHAAMLSDLKLFSKAADDNEPAKATVAKGVDGMPPAPKAAKDSGHVTSDAYLGMDIVDASGKKVGEVEDVVVDLSTGQASYALVEFDRSWSPNDKLFAFKPSELSPANGGKNLQVKATRESLERMPSLDKKALDKSDLSRMPMSTR